MFPTPASCKFTPPYPKPNNPRITLTSGDHTAQLPPPTIPTPAKPQYLLQSMHPPPSTHPS